ETVGHHGARTVMAQRFIPEIVDGDKRIVLIAGEPVPHSLARIPKPGETRGNLAAGGRGVARALSPRDRLIAETIGAKLWADGLLVVGLDVIGDYLTEINVTSPTGFVEITKQTGFDVADRFAGALVDALDTGDGVLIFSDIYGATPCNLAAKLLVAGRVEAVAGVNLPMLVRAFTYRDKGMETMIKKAISGGCDGVLHIDVDPIYA